MLGIIGGTGLYKLEGAQLLEELMVETPFGNPSSTLKRVLLHEKECLFLPRHGEHHSLLPHEVNYRANIFALKQAGATQILSLSAVGSLQEDIQPGDFALIHQYIDFTKGLRRHSFFENGLLAHISTADPICKDLSTQCFEQAKACDLKIHRDKTYICVEGPRLGTRAESHWFRSMGADVIGMTNVPEAFLAREAQICYASIGIVTDYDCWKEGESAGVQDILKQYKESIKNITAYLASALKNISEKDCPCRHALGTSLMSDPNSLNSDQRQILNVLYT